MFSSDKKLISSALKHHRSKLQSNHKKSKKQRLMDQDVKLSQKDLDYDTDEEENVGNGLQQQEEEMHVPKDENLQGLMKGKKKRVTDSNDKEQLKPVYRGAWSDSDSNSDDDSDDSEDEMDTSASDNDSSSSDDESSSSDDDQSGQDAMPANKKWHSKDLHTSAKSDRMSTHQKTAEDKEQEVQEAKYMQKKRAQRLKDAVEDNMNQKYASEDESDTDEQDDEQTTDELEQELVSDLKEKLNVVQNQLHPLLEKIRGDGFATEEGVSYLETKYQLLLSYCMNIVFFLTMKATGESVEDHPVIEYLVEQRKLLEQIKPIDDRMKYQLDKLVSIAKTEINMPSQEADEVDESSETSSEQEESSTSKPNLDAMMDDSSSSDDESSSSDEEAPTKRKKSKKKDLYVAPKLMAVSSNMDQRESRLSKHEKKKEKLKQKLADTGILQDVVEDFGDAPVVQESVGSQRLTGSKAVRFAQDLEDYEMKNMRRIQLTKDQKKLLRKAEENIENFDDELDNLEAFSEYIDHEAKEKDIEDEKVTVMEYLGNEDEARKYLESNGKSQSEKSNRKRKRMDDVDFDTTSQNDVEAIPRSKKMRRLAENKKLGSSKQDDRRSATKRELKNRGLTTSKRADQKNPRVRFKKRYSKMTAQQRKLANQMEKLRGGDGSVPRVDANVVRSRKAK